MLSSSSLSALLTILAGLASPVTMAEAVLEPSLLVAVQEYSPVEFSRTSGMVRLNTSPLEVITSSGVSRVSGCPSRAQSTSRTGGKLSTRQRIFCSSARSVRMKDSEIWTSGGYSTCTVTSLEVGSLLNPLSAVQLYWPAISLLTSATSTSSLSCDRVRWGLRSTWSGDRRESWGWGEPARREHWKERGRPSTTLISSAVTSRTGLVLTTRSC